ncbi:MAG: Ribose transport system permease protein RbsC [Candidatus Aminicenantes bacterium ADurb.Bin508]|nr:MAG: Ribose transport system permease protein RbsC [Candidatus Aminicenantes bacterium ADurb.Bin508]HNX41054.1 ABC transporter permease [Candidatus Aminicenantes bacterium]HPB55817.1 ABC transporter permease [Candidatus Aminicenantes bacterium]HPS99444.1 ABC transporter permease [Candidatus Aminicenantes bacterium]
MRKNGNIKIFQWLGPFLGLILIILLFSLVPEVRESFLRGGNFRSILTQSVIVGLCALGMTFIIITGGIDLSVGSSIALSSVVVALAVKSGLSPWAAILCGILLSGAIGFLNGLLITTLRVIPFIVTLGMLGIARGSAKWLAGNQKIDAPLSWVNNLMSRFPDPPWLVFAPAVWILLLLGVGAAILLNTTVFGRWTFAIGSNEKTARLCGVPVNRMKVVLYTLGGLLTGLAGVMEFSRLTVGDPTVANGTELDVVAAVVIGGGSLNGGEGSILGTLIGVLIMAVLRNGCTMMGWPNYIQEIIIGVIIVMAVAIDRFRTSRSIG